MNSTLSLAPLALPPPHIGSLPPLQAHHMGSMMPSFHMDNDHLVDPQGHLVVDSEGNMVSSADLKPMNPFLAILLLYGTMFLMIGAQMALVLWKKKHQKSYDLVTLIGLWIMPLLFSVILHFWRFCLVWLCYSVYTLYVLKQCIVPKLAATTPRIVYSFFLGVYRLSRTIGIIGYAMVFSEALGSAPLLNLILPIGTSIDCLWYGIYFGVLGRDCAEVASDWMASTVSRNLNARINDCGVCGGPLGDYSHLGSSEQKPEEATVQLSCKHCFHDLCIRGWTMVGKKDMCPCCNEKVDLKDLYADRPWETRNMSWIQMLDMVRYLVVWNPLIFMVISFLFHFIAPNHKNLHGLHSVPWPPPPPPGILALDTVQ